MNSKGDLAHLPDNSSILEGQGGFDRIASAQFESCYRSQSGRVRMFFRREIQDAEAAEDLFQETFLRVFRYGNSFDESRGNQTAWVLTIARNVLIDYFRSRGAQEIVSSNPAEDFVQPKMEESSLSQEQILGALERLPKSERDVLFLRKLEKRSVEETAAILKISRRTTNRRLALGLKKLRDVLQEFL